MTDAAPVSRPGPAFLLTSYLVVTALGGLAGLYGAFFVPAGPYVAGSTWPLTGPLALVANFALGRVAGRLTGHVLAGIAPMLAWLLVALVLASSRPEGDVVVTGDLRGYAFLLLGIVGSALGLGLLSRPRH